MDPVLCSVADARRALGIGLTKTYELIAAQKLRAVKVGRRTLIRTDSIRALVDELEAA